MGVVENNNIRSTCSTVKMLVAGVFRGLTRGARRGTMTGKKGNRLFYKGRGAKGVGLHTRKGGFTIDRSRIPTLVVPNLDGFELKPYVSYKTPYIVGKPLRAQDILDAVNPDTSNTS